MIKLWAHHFPMNDERDNFIVASKTNFLFILFYLQHTHGTSLLLLRPNKIIIKVEHDNYYYVRSGID